MVFVQLPECASGFANAAEVCAALEIPRNAIADAFNSLKTVEHSGGPQQEDQLQDPSVEEANRMCVVALSKLCQVVASLQDSHVVFAYEGNLVWLCGEDFSVINAFHNTGAFMLTTPDGVETGTTSKITSIKLFPLRPTSPSQEMVCIVGYESGHMRLFNQERLLLEQRIGTVPIRQVALQPLLPLSSNAVPSLVYSDVAILFDSYVAIVEGRGLAEAVHHAKVGEDASIACKTWKLEDRAQSTGLVCLGKSAPVEYDHLISGGVFDVVEEAATYLVVGSRPIISTYSTLGVDRPFFSVTSFVSSAATDFSKAVSSMIGSLWGSAPKKAAPKRKTERVRSALDESQPLPMIESLSDPTRSMLSIRLSPDRTLAATTDGFGRVLLLDVSSYSFVRIWKGYRDALCFWVTSDQPTSEDVEQLTQLASDATARVQMLGIYAPRRGLLEIYAVPLGARVAAFNVGKGSIILPASDNLCVLRNEELRLKVVRANGAVHELVLPYAAILSSSASRHVVAKQTINTLLAHLGCDPTASSPRPSSAPHPATSVSDWQQVMALVDHLVSPTALVDALLKVKLQSTLCLDDQLKLLRHIQETLLTQANQIRETHEVDHLQALLYDSITSRQICSFQQLQTLAPSQEGGMSVEPTTMMASVQHLLDLISSCPALAYSQHVPQCIRRVLNIAISQIARHQTSSAQGDSVSVEAVFLGAQRAGLEAQTKPSNGGSSLSFQSFCRMFALSDGVDGYMSVGTTAETHLNLPLEALRRLYREDFASVQLILSSVINDVDKLQLACLLFNPLLTSDLSVDTVIETLSGLCLSVLAQQHLFLQWYLHLPAAVGLNAVVLSRCAHFATLLAQMATDQELVDQLYQQFLSFVQGETQLSATPSEVSVRATLLLAACCFFASLDQVDKLPLKVKDGFAAQVSMVLKAMLLAAVGVAMTPVDAVIPLLPHLPPQQALVTLLYRISKKQVDLLRSAAARVLTSNPVDSSASSSERIAEPYSDLPVDLLDIMAAFCVLVPSTNLSPSLTLAAMCCTLVQQFLGRSTTSCAIVGLVYDTIRVIPDRSVRLAMARIVWETCVFPVLKELLIVNRKVGKAVKDRLCVKHVKLSSEAVVDLLAIGLSLATTLLVETTDFQYTTHSKLPMDADADDNDDDDDGAGEDEETAASVSTEEADSMTQSAPHGSGIGADCFANLSVSELLHATQALATFSQREVEEMKLVMGIDDVASSSTVLNLFLSTFEELPTEMQQASRDAQQLEPKVDEAICTCAASHRLLSDVRSAFDLNTLRVDRLTCELMYWVMLLELKSCRIVELLLPFQQHVSLRFNPSLLVDRCCCVDAPRTTQEVDDNGEDTEDEEATSSWRTDTDFAEAVAAVRHSFAARLPIRVVEMTKDTPHPSLQLLEQSPTAQVTCLLQELQLPSGWVAQRVCIALFEGDCDQQARDLLFVLEDGSLTSIAEELLEVCRQRCRRVLVCGDPSAQASERAEGSGKVSKRRKSDLEAMAKARLMLMTRLSTPVQQWVSECRLSEAKLHTCVNLSQLAQLLQDVIDGLERMLQLVSDDDVQALGPLANSVADRDFVMPGDEALVALFASRSLSMPPRESVLQEELSNAQQLHTACLNL
eukprot:m.67824 g.67824  ORF g.67824 m.67824 type:complete len:1618 (+) comp12177_c0_seq1:217-5070(+)